MSVGGGRIRSVDARDDYVLAADAALTLLREPAVAAAWDTPSSLALMSVGALASHLANQITMVPDLLQAQQSDQPPITVLEHYTQVKWRGADLDNEVNAGIRAGSEAGAQSGPEAVADKAAAALERARTLLPLESVDRLIHLSWAGWSLRLSDFLTTRMLEIVVHSDDLAFSVDIPTPHFPESVTDRVIGLLGQLAVQRHGVTAVLRGLSRAERAPASIAAI
jgi:hypothetical protein